MRLTPLLFAAALALLALPALGEDRRNPHGQMNVEGSCKECHLQDVKLGVAPKRPLLFKKDIVSICLDCHVNKDVASVHPVDIRPGMVVPDTLPMDHDGTITCATCHNPHSSPEADRPYIAEALTKRVFQLFSMGEKSRTFFLRMPNDDGQICVNCHDRTKVTAMAGFHRQAASRIDKYAGSAKCGSCHADVYKKWELTPHARMARDPKSSPESVLGDFTNNPPFQRKDVVYVLGSRWTQRYVVEKNGRYFVKAPIWSITGKSWDRSYWVDKPWDLFCEGCHTTGFESKGEAKFAELGIGCEACHGPGKAHADAGGSGHIINPAKLTSERREMICQSCHTSGHDASGQFKFPLGYLPGEDLTIFYKGLTPKPGQDNATFMGDGSYEDRNRQWRFWKDSFLNAKGITCDICKNFRDRQTKSETETKMSITDHCLTCHDGSLKKTPTHTTHMAKNVACDKCHVPAAASGGENYSIHDHKFHFGKPPAKRAASAKESCKGCHEKYAARP